jgi:pimeloyl-ACP methyl ester carboxylesterase
VWYEAAGEGPAVVLLHAGIADSRMGDGHFEALASRHRAARIDFRGYGRSPLPGGPFSYVEDVRFVVDALRLAPTAVIGASFGGRVAIDLALAHPDRVSALGLVAPALGGWKEAQELERLEAEEERLLGAGDRDGAVELNLRAWVDARTGARTPSIPPCASGSARCSGRRSRRSSPPMSASRCPARSRGWSRPP